jgi:hypothetical protein
MVRLLVVLVLVCRPAIAEVPAGALAEVASERSRTGSEVQDIIHVWGALATGQGLRLNNPYRLQTQLGTTAESLSLTAPYAEACTGVLLGNPYGFQQGPALNFSVALVGVPQQVLAPGYMLLSRVSRRWGLWVRAALPVIIQPDVNLGLDLALGGGFRVLAGFGLFGEVVASVFEGAATDQRQATLIPVVSLQAGLSTHYEVLP